MCLKDQHTVAETEKAVTLVYCDPVCVHCVFIAHECRNEHDERTFGKVEVGDKPVNALELIAGIDEYIRVALVSGNVAEECGNAFKSAAGCSSDSNDSAAIFLGLVDEVGGFLRQEVVLAVHFVVEYVVLLDGAESSETDMESYESGLDTARVKLIKKLGRKVKSRSRSCRRAEFARVDCLVALLISKFFRI